MNLRLEQYRIFNVVANTCSFSKAANELYMTQSAVSQAIKQLETSINMILFKRTSKGVELTEAGNILLKYTSSAMELLETGLHRIEALKSLDEGIKWIRFLYSYPETITDELIKVVKENDKICKYFDIPLQHISDPVLKRMNRKSNEESIRKLISNAFFVTFSIHSFKYWI